MKKNIFPKKICLIIGGALLLALIVGAALIFTQKRQQQILDETPVELSSAGDGNYVQSQTLLVTLESNPTTGYVWSYVADGDALLMVEEDYLSDCNDVADSVMAQDIALGALPTTAETLEASAASTSTALTETQTESVMTGCGGKTQFKVVALQPGHATVTFNYSRPWESVQPLKTVTYTIDVDEKLHLSETHTDIAENPETL